MKIADRVPELLGQVRAVLGFAGAVHAKAGAFHDHVAQHHIRVLHKIAVHTDAVFIGIQMHPIRLNVRHTVTLLQEDNVAGDFRTGVALEGVVREADRADQIGALGKVLSDGGVFLVHRAFAGDKGHDAARTHLVQGLAEKVIVDQPMVFVVLFVQHLEIPKRHVAHGHIKEAVGHLHLFKAVHGDPAVLIELLGDAPGNAVDLHAVGFAPGHAVGQHPDEVSDAAGWLQNVPGLEAHLREGAIHGLNDNGRGVKSRQRTGSGGGVLILFKQGFQFFIVDAALVKAIGQTAPAHIAGEDFLFLLGGKPPLRFDLFQSADRLNIGIVFLSGGAVAQLWVGDVEVVSFFGGYLRAQHRKLHALPALLRRREGDGLLHGGRWLGTHFTRIAINCFNTDPFGLFVQTGIYLPHFCDLLGDIPGPQMLLGFLAVVQIILAVGLKSGKQAVIFCLFCYPLRRVDRLQVALLKGKHILPRLLGQFSGKHGLTEHLINTI